MASLIYQGASPLILASRSPRRHELLRRLEVDFDIRPADIAEEHAPGLTQHESAVEVAAQKARSVAGRLDRGLVLGADTIVVLDGEILGKPRDTGEARDMLGRLTGRSHTVITRTRPGPC